ncbi:MAG TPA: helix-turn-helix transcriptional regulator [Caulobacteraceae bacterium]|nr:helix-turn-helix transcriptional regulator [Caulobacteraceae bacterium]
MEAIDLVAKFNQLRMRQGETAGSAHFIREWRKHRGLTQKDLAEQIGITRSYLSMIETGARPYRPELVAAATAALGCAPEELIGGGPAKPDDILSLWSNLTEAERADGLVALRTMFGRVSRE